MSDDTPRDDESSADTSEDATTDTEEAQHDDTQEDVQDEVQDDTADAADQEDAAQEDTDKQGVDEDTAQETAADNTGKTTGADAGIVDRIQQMPAEDWLLVALGLLVVVTVGVMYVDIPALMDSEETPADADPEVVSYCKDVAQAVETESRLPEGTTCDCVPPGQFDEEKYQTASKKVQDVTELFLVDCTLPSGQDMTFPIGYIPEDVETNMSDISGNNSRDNVTVVQ